MTTRNLILAAILAVLLFATIKRDFEIHFEFGVISGSTQEEER